MWKARLAFVSLTVVTAWSLVHCGTSETKPPIEEQNNGGDAYVPPVYHRDSAPDPDTAPPPDTSPPPDTTPIVATVVLSTNAVDFQTVPCGTQAAAKNVTLTNKGNTPLHISYAMLNGGTYFDVALISLGAGGGTPSQAIDLGVLEQATVRITPKAIPSVASVAANNYTDTISLITVPAITTQTNTAITVQETAKGAILSFSPTGADFGAVPINKKSASDFVIANTGNDTAEVTLGSNNPAHFTFSALGPISIPAGTQAKVTATFSPTDTSPQYGTFTMTPTVSSNTTLCAPLGSPFQMSGSGSSGSALVSPTSLSFGTNGYVACGTQASSLPLTITNTGNAAFNWTATLTSGGNNYTLSPSSGTVQPNGGTAVVQVQPNPIPQTSQVTSELYSGTLSITTDATGDTAHIVQLHETAQGAILNSSAGGAIAFGGVAINQTSTQQYNITNSGNVDANVTLSKANPVFGIANTMPIAVKAGLNQVAMVNFTPPSAQTYTDKITASATSANNAFCGPALPDISLTGSGTTGVSVAPGNLNFGIVNCGGSAAPLQRLTLTNTGAQMQWTPTFGKGAAAPYALAYSSGQQAPYVGAITPGNPYTLAAGTAVNIDVVPTPIVHPASTVPNAFGDTLTVTTNSPGDSPHNIQLTETAQGGYLAVSPSFFLISANAAPGITNFYGFQVTNQGNYPVGYSLVASPVQNALSTTFAMNVTSGSLAPNSSTSGILLQQTDDGSALAQSTGSIQVSAQAPPSGQPLILCSDPIPPVVINVCNHGISATNQCNP